MQIIKNLPFLRLASAENKELTGFGLADAEDVEKVQGRGLALFGSCCWCIEIVCARWG